MLVELKAEGEISCMEGKIRSYIDHQRALAGKIVTQTHNLNVIVLYCSEP